MNLKDFLNKCRRKQYSNYEPTYEWFKLDRSNIIEIASNQKDIVKVIDRYKNFYQFQNKNGLFDKNNNKFIDLCYGSVTINEKYIPILNHPLMIRLMDLNQLSLTYKFYFSATHNRFSHSIGTYKKITDIIDHLKTFSDVKDFITKNEDLLKIYALVHDIGALPFAHSLDYVFKSNDKIRLKEILSNDKDLGGIISTILEENGVSFKKFLAIATTDSEKVKMKDFSDLDITLSDLDILLMKCMDSPLDADRFDWLQRDILLCKKDSIQGQIDAIVSNMRPFRNEEGNWIIGHRTNTNIEKTNIKEGDKTILQVKHDTHPHSVLEIIELLHRRHQMYTGVYELDRKVILEELIGRLLYQLFDSNQIDTKELCSFSEGMILNLIIEYSNPTQDEMLRKALFGHDYKLIFNQSIRESRDTNRSIPNILDLKTDIKSRIAKEDFLCSECGLNKNSIIMHFPKKFMSDVNEIVLVDNNLETYHLEDDENYKAIKYIDEKNASEVQIFLLDDGNGRFFDKKQKAIKEIREHIYSES